MTFILYSIYTVIFLVEIFNNSCSISCIGWKGTTSIFIANLAKGFMVQIQKETKLLIDISSEGNQYYIVP